MTQLVWPTGCYKPGTCSRHRRCMYTNCVHEQRVIEDEIDAATDDAAVDQFANMMKVKLSIARAKGRSGWQTVSEKDLMRMLRDHVKKGDMRDVANIAMMIHLNRENKE